MASSDKKYEVLTLGPDSKFARNHSHVIQGMIAENHRITALQIASGSSLPPEIRSLSSLQTLYAPECFVTEKVLLPDNLKCLSMPDSSVQKELVLSSALQWIDVSSTEVGSAGAISGIHCKDLQRIYVGGVRYRNALCTLSEICAGGGPSLLACLEETNMGNRDISDLIKSFNGSPPRVLNFDNCFGFNQKTADSLRKSLAVDLSSGCALRFISMRNAEFENFDYPWKIGGKKIPFHLIDDTPVAGDADAIDEIKQWADVIVTDCSRRNYKDMGNLTAKAAIRELWIDLSGSDVTSVSSPDNKRTRASFWHQISK